VGVLLEGINILRQWFSNCAPRIPRDPRPVPRGSVRAFF